MVMKRRILLAVFLVMVIGTVTAQFQNSCFHIINSPHKTESSLGIPTIQTPSYQIFRVKNYYFLIKSPKVSSLLPSIASDQRTKESGQHLSLSPSYTFNIKKMGLPQLYNPYKITAVDVVLEVTGMLLNLAFPDQKGVDL